MAGSTTARAAAALLAAGQREAAGLPWGWSRFADGTTVPRLAGDLLAALGRDGERFGADPLGAGPASFRAWLAAPVDDAEPPITRFWTGVHGLRADLRESFPDPLGGDRAAYAAWIEANGAREHGVEERARRRWWQR
jgi:hypothetical protein